MPLPLNQYVPEAILLKAKGACRVPVLLVGAASMSFSMPIPFGFAGAALAAMEAMEQIVGVVLSCPVSIVPSLIFLYHP